MPTVCTNASPGEPFDSYLDYRMLQVRERQQTPTGLCEYLCGGRLRIGP